MADAETPERGFCGQGGTRRHGDTKMMIHAIYLTAIGLLTLAVIFYRWRARTWKQNAREIADGKLKNSFANFGPVFARHLAASMAPEMAQKAYDLTRERLIESGELPDRSWPDEITENTDK